ncbi:PfkB family carbohydrate kinase [Actinobaculum suis]|uniref:PfkB family carbohydrate kinase n=1 Tax=Actinobaculum suis TaxID=1657 RepID=UPI0012E24231|nr:PfkB family carbohydrate kinase [Actinobaculum suis]
MAGYIWGRNDASYIGGRRVLMRGLFVGLATLDVIQLVSALPQPDEKIRARRVALAAGGPAANAAVAFAQRFPRVSTVSASSQPHSGSKPQSASQPHTAGPSQAVPGPHTAAHPQEAPGPHTCASLNRADEAILLTRLSADLVGNLIRADLEEHQVTVHAQSLPAGVSSTVATILVTESTGERAVISATDQRPVQPEPAEIGLDLCNLRNIDVIETDGYETDLTLAVLQAGRAHGIPTILDGGSWKPYMEQLLPYIDVAIVSEAFAATCAQLSPGPESSSQVRHTRASETAHALFAYLEQFGVQYAAITRGPRPILYRAAGKYGEVLPCQVAAVDTLGAGDFFHGAFTKSIAGKPLNETTFVAGLHHGAQIAAQSIQSFGTRTWLR